MSEPPINWNLLIPAAVIYSVIFVVSVLGNITTCIVIVRNKFMHTSTNYYLFSLAIADLQTAVFGLLPWILTITYRNLESGTEACVAEYYMSEFAVYASVLIITAFTIERYIAICHPVSSHKLIELPRTVKYIIAIWIVAACLAVPTVVRFLADDCYVENSFVTSIYPYAEYSFVISLLIIFAVPLTMMIVLYTLIARKLRESRAIISTYDTDQKNTFKMLVAIVASSFLCWIPFQCYRLFHNHYIENLSEEEALASYNLYICIDCYLVEIPYFISTAIHPILYNLMSNKFRKAFLTTFWRKRLALEDRTSATKEMSSEDNNVGA